MAQDLRSFLKGTEAAIAQLQTARGPLATAIAGGTMITELLKDMRKLAFQSANVVVGADQRLPLYAEFRNKMNQINMATQTADFAGTNLLLGNTSSLTPPTLTVADATTVATVATGGTKIVPGAFGPTGNGFAVLNGTTISIISVNSNNTLSAVGSFTDPGGIAGVEIRAVDVNNDGLSDVLIDRGGGQPAGAMIVQPDNTVRFINSSAPLAASGGAALLGLDYTGDANPDAIASAGAGLGGFVGGSGGDVTLVTTIGAATTAVETGDFDGDGVLDLLSNGLLYRGLDLAFAPVVSLVPGATDYAAGDIDNDGRTDVVALIGGAIRVFRNLGEGRFFETTLAPIGGAGGNRIELADTTGDGNLDVIAYGAGSINVALSDGAGNFGAFGTIAAGVGNDIALADIDRDGRTEIAATQGGLTSFIKVTGGPGPGTTKFVADARGTLKTLVHQPMTSAGLSIDGISLERDGLAVVRQLDRALSVAGIKLGRLANQLREIDKQIDFASGVRDSTDVGLGGLVDTDLARQQARFVANQVKLQLNIQGLQIANNSQNILLNLLG